MRRNEDLLCEALAVPRILCCREEIAPALGFGEPQGKKGLSDQGMKRVSAEQRGRASC